MMTQKSSKTNPEFIWWWPSTAEIGSSLEYNMDTFCMYSLGIRLNVK